MKEQKLATELINGALSAFNNRITPYPAIIIDKQEYKDYDFKTLELELAKQKFKMCDMLNAPVPFNYYPTEFRKKKIIIFQQK